MRRVLIISPSFPPMNAPDMQRVRMSLPHYRENGWEPIVLTVSPDVQIGSREAALEATIPADISIHRCRAFPLSWSRKIGLGNLGLRSWFHLLIAGARIIEREKIDVVFFSNTQFITFTLGRIWKRWFGTPYVIDLQDPWRTDYYESPGAHRPPGGWKYQLARAQAYILEGWSFRQMSALISVSQTYLEDLRKRYPWFRHTPQAVIRFGASETDFAIAQSLPVSAFVPPREPHTIRLVYTGAAAAITQDSVRVLFGGLALFRQRHPDSARRLRFEFLGTSYAAAGQGIATILPAARDFGVADQVHELPQRLGHLECLQIQAQADVLLLLGSRDAAYSPSKIYPYFMAKRPTLAVVFQASYLEQILRELGGFEIVSVSPSGDRALDSGLSTLDSAAAASAHEHICTFFEQIVSLGAATPLPARNEAFFREHFLASSLTARQCEVFSAACHASSADVLRHV